MNKKFIGVIAVVFGASVVAAVWAGSELNNAKNAPRNSQTLTDQEFSRSSVVMPENDIVQVYLFHATQRCSTCIAIGQLAGETVNEFFQSELQEGKIEFREINIDLPENQALAEKFQASGSALYINNYRDGKDNITEDVKVWRLTNDETGFKNYLKGELNNILGK